MDDRHNTIHTFEERRALIALSLVPGIGSGRIRSLLARFGSASAILEAPSGMLSKVDGIGAQTARSISSFDDFDSVDDQLRRAERAGASLLPTWDDEYPALLREIYDPPALLWQLGSIGKNTCHDRAISIVGTRKASEYGRRMAYEFAFALAEAGFTIVSGLAYGIDAEAHRGALDAGGCTLAVLGSGVDRIYPTRHLQLAQSICERGAILSEYPLGAAPDAPNFPRRNRIVSGLAKGTLVIEAYKTGGALITARLALEQNREVFAVPSPIHSRSGEGSNRLIQQGYAKLVLSIDDILDELGIERRQEQVGMTKQPPADLNQIETTLYNALSPDPIHIDTLCEKTNIDTSTALVYLLNLEFRGLVRQMAGKQFYRA